MNLGLVLTAAPVDLYREGLCVARVQGTSVEKRVAAVQQLHGLWPTKHCPLQ